jgi:DNA polymerase I-like protein with 3'-5' exonuclease and polymerase domains
MTTFLSSDAKMYEAYNSGKDLYAMIAQSAFDNEYEDNLEFYPPNMELEIDGKKVITGKKTHVNKAGKERRSVGKVLNLAATYGMSGATAGARLGKTRAEGDELLKNFFDGFPGVRDAIEQSKAFLKKNGYVEDFVGRRRRLSDINLPPYEVILQNVKTNDADFNPIIGCSNRKTIDPRIKKWEKLLQDQIDRSNTWRSQKAFEAGESYEPSNELSNKAFDKLAKAALQDGVIIQANTGRIAQASRQCFNARIQGSAASLTKMAMIDIFNDEELKQYQANLVITVHDEVLVECPAYYADKVEQRLPQIMIEAAKSGGDDVPQACDPYVVSRWYCDTAAVAVQSEFKKLADKGLDRDTAFSELYKKHPELPEEAIYKTITEGIDLEF